MSLSDCEKCWSTPCRCGHNYKSWSSEDINRQIIMLRKVISDRGEILYSDIEIKKQNK